VAGRDHGGSGSVRSVEPHRLVCSGHVWYLLGWDTDREGWRTFRVDRVAPRIPTGPRLTPRDLPDEDIAAHVTRGVWAAGWRCRARVVLHAPAESVARRIPPRGRAA
jgi:predicted DNA-binding transcriptional regulator YafY